ncbi:MAG: hypothetical protein GY752_00690 [bacterium]|nr:hypothetical protein [bacterium]
MQHIRILLFAMFCLILQSSVTMAGNVTAVDARAICLNWLDSVVISQGSWAGSDSPVINSHSKLITENLLVGYKFDIEPSGYVIVPSITELAPVKSWSETGLFMDGGFSGYVLDNLHGRVELATQLTSLQVLEAFPDAQTNYNLHRKLCNNPVQFSKSHDTTVSPLLETAWHQDYPFNEYCPIGDGGRTYVGCTPLAAAQLVRYHQWPVSGTGTEQWWWSGDIGCGGNSSGTVIYAEYGDPFDWDNMPPGTVMWNADQEVKDAVAELCFDMSAACHTEFSRCGSQSVLADVKAALIQHFRYSSSAQELMRFSYPQEETWFAFIQQELQNGRPLLYSSLIHTMVCDGFRIVDDMNQIHLNFGWGGDSDNWFTLDNIETSYYDLTEKMLIGITPEITGLEPELENFTVARENNSAMLNWSVPGYWSEIEFLVFRSNRRGCYRQETSAPMSGLEEYSFHSHRRVSASTRWKLLASDSFGNEWEYGPIGIDYESLESYSQGSVVVTNGAYPQISFSLPAAGDVAFSVYNLRGEVVLKRQVAGLPGLNTILWDGTNNNGRSVSSGAYFAKVSATGCSESCKFILSK